VAAGIGSLYLRKDGGAGTSIYRKESTTVATGWVPVTTTVLDYKIKVSSNDTTENYLLAKLAAGIGIALSETGDGGDEDVTIRTAVDTGGWFASVTDQITGPTLVPVSTDTAIDIVIDSSRDWNGKSVHITGVAAYGNGSVTAAADSNLWETTYGTQFDTYIPKHAALSAGFSAYWDATTSGEQYIMGMVKASNPTGAVHAGWYVALNASGHLILRMYGRQTTSGGGLNFYHTAAWVSVREV